jgi:hypothetical protein
VPDVVVVVESDGWVEGFWIGSTFIVIGYIAVEEKNIFYKNFSQKLN